jgi:hypothetical protein
MMELLTVALDSWIIQDGNYGEFQIGDLTTFALEFQPRLETIEMTSEALVGPSSEHIADSIYRVVAPIVYATPDWWVIDIGIPVYQERVPPIGAAIGRWVKGEISLAIDPFFYFERLALLPESPPLIFEWEIDGIDLQTAPFIEREPGIEGRDPSLHGWKRIARTDAWRDDDGRAVYLLHCKLKSRIARHSLIA